MKFVQNLKRLQLSGCKNGSLLKQNRGLIYKPLFCYLIFVTSILIFIETDEIIELTLEQALLQIVSKQAFRF